MRALRPPPGLQRWRNKAQAHGLSHAFRQYKSGACAVVLDMGHGRISGAAWGRGGARQALDGSRAQVAMQLRKYGRPLSRWVVVYREDAA